MTRWFTYLAIVALVMACAESPVRTEPRGEPGIRVVSGAALEDTVAATLSAPLAIEVHDSRGAPAVGVAVEFTSTTEQVIQNGGATRVAHLQLRGTGGTEWASSTTSTTDDAGRAAVQVRFGERAAAAAVVIKVAALGYADTATYTIRPGQPARFVAQPRDSTLYVGSTYTLRAGWEDRFGNRRPDTVTYSSVSDAVALDASGGVRGRHTGRATILLHSQGRLLDSLFVSVVPPGVIAAWWQPISSGTHGRLLTFQTDGSEMSEVSLSEMLCSVRGIQWQPGGAALVFSASTPAVGCHYPRLYRTEAMRSARRLIDGSSLAAEMWPYPDPSGSWLYFTGQPDHQNGELWRVRADGSGAERVGEIAGWSDLDTYPSPSSDGVHLLYASNRLYKTTTWRPALRTLNLQTGAVHDLPLIGSAPRWSPNEELIAFWLDDEYSVARADGTDQRTLAQARYSSGNPDPPSWSPDSEWIVVVTHDPNGYAPLYGRLALVEVATGEVLPLAWSSQMTYPSWRR